MGTQVRSPSGARPLVDRVARHISDPVVRLKFLKAAAPVPRAPGWAWPRALRRLWLIALAALVAALAVVAPLALFSRLRASPRIPAPLARIAARVPAADARAPSDVWLVERNGGSETYSNGLRIDNRFLVATHPRAYLAFPADGGAPVKRRDPVGIAFHTTESRQAPFEAKENRALRRLGESLLEYVQRRQAYNFVIDRFGRVYRVVAEDETANHSGYSAWADGKWFFINLNESFLGVSFEAVSPAAQEAAGISPAQARSAAILIEMLRHRYGIAAAECVTHAQISVNPQNMRVGLHLDWAAGFPFEALGLPDNYAAALPAMWAYGFDCDPNYTSRAGARLRAGIERAETILAQRAAAAGVEPAQYKKDLRRRYREMLAAVKHARPEEEPATRAEGL